MIIAEFTNQNEISITDALYQYDYGREMQIKGLSLPQSVEIHFSFTETIGESTTVLGTTTDDITSVMIPNEFLQKETTEDYIIYVYIYVADENKGQTIKEIKLYVKARTKPSELEDLTDEQTRLLEQLISAINSKADNITYSNNILRLLAGQTELARVTISGGGGGGSKAEIDSFIDNVDIDYSYDESTGANYTIIRVYRDKIDGTKQYPFVYAPNGAEACQMSTYEIAHNDGWLLAINGGIFNTTTHKADGPLVENGIIYQNSSSQTHPNCRPLIISNTGELSEGSTNADATTLVNNGAISVICGFMAIVKNYQAVPSSEWNNVSHYTQNAQRQIIGQFGNGDYAIITCEGRNFDNSDGWTIAEAQQICIKHGLKFAYNLDGGGSTETMLGLKHLNTIYEGTDGRKVPTFIVFNGTDKFNATPIEKHLASISATKTTTTYQVGTTLNTDDITVNAYFTDGTSKDVTSDAIINANSVNMETVGTYLIEISYTDNDITKTTSINIVVEDEETPIDYEFIRGYTLINTGEVAASSNRMTAITNTPNDAPIHIENDGLLGYFIKIPTGTTKVTIITPNYIAGIGLWNSEKIRVIDGGWSPTIGECSQTYEADTYSYLSVNIKNSSNSTIPVDVDTTNWRIEFN